MNIPLIGRDKELKELQDFIASDGGGVCIVHGREGIGKTKLIQEINSIYNNSIYTKIYPGHTPQAYISKIINENTGFWKTLLKSLTFSFGYKGIGLDINLKDLIENDQLSKFPLEYSYAIFKKTSERLNIESHNMFLDGRAIFIVDPDTDLKRSEQLANLFYYLFSSEQISELNGIKFIISQRDNDVFIPGFCEQFNDLVNNIHIKYLHLDYIKDKIDQNIFINEYDKKNKKKSIQPPLTDSQKDEIIQKYKGWPIEIVITIEDYYKNGKIDFNRDFKRILQDRYDNLRTYEKEICRILAVAEHEVDSVMLREISAINNIGDVLTDNNFKRYLIISKENHTISLFHSTFASKIKEFLKEYNEIDLYYDKFAKYWHKFIENKEISKIREAYRYYTYYLYFKNNKSDFLEAVNNYSWDKIEKYSLYLTTIEDIKKAISILKSKGLHNLDKNYYSNFLYCIGESYRFLGNYDEAIKFFDKALQVEKKLYPDEINSQVAIRYNNIGLPYCHKGEFDKAIEFYNKSLLINKKVYPDGIHREIAHNYNNLGAAYRLKGEFDKAIEFYNKALIIYKKLYPDEIHINIAIFYSNIGEIYHQKEKYDKAIMYYNKSLQIDRKIICDEFYPGIALTYANIANSFCAKSEYDKAIEFYNKALLIYRKVYPDENHHKIVNIYIDIGNIYELKGEYDKAIEFHNKALLINEKCKFQTFF